MPSNTEIYLTFFVKGGKKLPGIGQFSGLIFYELFLKTRSKAQATAQQDVTPFYEASLARMRRNPLRDASHGIFFPLAASGDIGHGL